MVAAEEALAPGKLWSDPRLVHGKPAVAGGLSPEVVTAVLRRTQGRMSFCFDRAHRATMRATLTFTVDDQGTVGADAKAVVDPEDTAIATCLERSVEALAFPAKSATVTYPVEAQRRQLTEAERRRETKWPSTELSGRGEGIGMPLPGKRP